MDFEVMKKKLDTYRKSNGQFGQVSAELLLEFLRMWECHVGPSSELASKLGMRTKQMGFLVREARKLAKNSQVVDPAFQSLQLNVHGEEGSRGTGIELAWGTDKVIRFPTVDVLIDFLRKAS
jgi:hypothetical protein